MGPPVKTEPVSVKDCGSSVKDLTSPVKAVKDDMNLKQLQQIKCNISK